MASDIVDTTTQLESTVESDITMDQTVQNAPHETRKQLTKELESIFRHRGTVVKELMMIYPYDDLDSSFGEFLKNGDMTTLDISKWNDYWENDTLRRVLASQGIDVPDLENLLNSVKVDALDSHSTLPHDLEILSDRADESNDQPHNREQDNLPISPSPNKLPAMTSISKTAQRTMLYTPNSADSRLTPVQTYNNLRLEDHRADKNGQFDLYAWTLKAKAQPLYKTLQTARKILTTQDWNLARNELKSIKTVQQIEHLKSKHMWSLKQIRRHTSVPRTKTHWDSVLDEMKWMRTDFKEERKWKIASAYMISRAVMEWHQVPDKSMVCVAARKPSPSEYLSADEDLTPNDTTLTTILDPALMDSSMINSTITDTVDMAKDSEEKDALALLDSIKAETDDTTANTDRDEVYTTKKDISDTERTSPELNGTMHSEQQLSVTSGNMDHTDDKNGGSESDDTVKQQIDGDKDSLGNTSTTANDNNNNNPAYATPHMDSGDGGGESNEHQDQELSAAKKRLCQQLIEECDSSHTVVTLPMEDFQHMDINALLPDNLTYGPPDPNMNDPYFNEAEYGRIVSLTKLSTVKFKTNTYDQNHTPSKRTIDGQPISGGHKVETDTVATLPGNNRYDTTPLISPLFAHKKVKDTPAVLPPTPHAPSSGIPSPGAWTEDDDLCLISLIVQFSFNWELICDAFNSFRASLAAEKRTPWELHERWRQNNLTSLSGQVNSVYAAKLKKELSRRQSIIKFDSPRKKQRQYSIFEAIKKTQRKREESQKTNNNASVPGNTIEVHGMNSSGKRLPTAMELSLHKIQRERQQALLEQRQMYGLSGTQGTNPNVVPRIHSPVASQVRPPTSATNVSGMQSTTSAAAPIMTNQNNALSNLANNPVGNNHVIRAPQPIPSNQNPALNRYPPAQLQLLRQQQMALMAAAQAQQQQQQQQQQQVQHQHQQHPQQQQQQQQPQPVQQQVQQQQNQLRQQQQQQQIPQSQSQALSQQQSASMIRPPVSIPMQRYTSNPMMPMNQPSQGAANQSPTLLSVMQQQQQQQPQQQASPVIQQQQQPQSVPSQQQQQQQQQQPQSQSPMNPATSLAFAAQLAQMGYPIQQLPPNQQMQLQRYLAQLQMRNAAAQQQQARQQQQQQHHLQQQQGMVNGSLGGSMGHPQPQQQQQQTPPQLMSSPLMNQQQQQMNSPHINTNAANTPAGYMTTQQQQQLQLHRFHQALLAQQQLQRQQAQQHQQSPQSSSPMIQHPPPHQPPS